MRVRDGSPKGKTRERGLRGADSPMPKADADEPADFRDLQTSNAEDKSALTFGCFNLVEAPVTDGSPGPGPSARQIEQPLAPVA